MKHSCLCDFLKISWYCTLLHPAAEDANEALVPLSGSSHRVGQDAMPSHRAQQSARCFSPFSRFSLCCALAGNSILLPRASCESSFLQTCGHCGVEGESEVRRNDCMRCSTLWDQWGRSQKFAEHVWLWGRCSDKLRCLRGVCKGTSCVGIRLLGGKHQMQLGVWSPFYSCDEKNKTKGSGRYKNLAGWVLHGSKWHNGHANSCAASSHCWFGGHGVQLSLKVWACWLFVGGRWKEWVRRRWSWQEEVNGNDAGRKCSTREWKIQIGNDRTGMSSPMSPQRSLCVFFCSMSTCDLQYYFPSSSCWLYLLKFLEIAWRHGAY